MPMRRVREKRPMDLEKVRILGGMSGTITRILTDPEGDPAELAERLVPVVYETMLQMARKRMAGERARITLQPTALVHEAYLRVMSEDASWENRRHFYGAVAEAMRRVLIEFARRRGRFKRGGALERVTLTTDLVGEQGDPARLLDVDRAIARLARSDPRKADLVKLRYYAGLTIPETARALGVSPATVKLDWSYARAWLHREVAEAGDDRSTA